MRARKTLYEVFGCSSKEELYRKVKLGGEEVRPLIDFIEFAKNAIFDESVKIHSPEIFAKYVENCKLPRKNEVLLVFTDAKLSVVHQTTGIFDTKKSIRKMLIEALNSGALNYFIVLNEKNYKNGRSDIENLLEKLVIKIRDRFVCRLETNELFSDMSKQTHKFYHPYSVDEGEICKNSIKDFGAFEYFDEFMEYYAIEEIKQLNIFSETFKVREKLKEGFQFLKQEVGGFLAFNKKGQVLEVNVFSRGGRYGTVMEPAIIFRKIINNPEIHSFAIFHNHPSGNPNPSDEDLKWTKMIAEIANVLSIKFFDHFIIGKEGTLSIAEYQIKQDVEITFDFSNYLRDVESLDNFLMPGKFDFER